jgi:hypothetical protein
MQPVGYNRERKMNKDEMQINEALISWFESQNVHPKQAMGAMVGLLGVMIGKAASSEASAVDGAIAACRDLAQLALRTAKLKG